MHDIIAIYIYLCLIAGLSGYKEGILYGLKGADSLPWNEHNIFMAERMCIAGVMFHCWLGGSIQWYYMITITVAWVLAFPFWHDGFYYKARRKIDSPPGYKFTGDSTSSTAKIEIKWWLRLTLKLISIGIMIAILVW